MVDTIPLYLILAAYNEASVLESVIKEIRASIDCVIIIVDDGSEDGTGEVAQQLGVRLVRHPINRGAGAACQTGIQLARINNWKHIAFMDADGQHIPGNLNLLVKKMITTDADLVIGSRFLLQENEIPHIRRVYNNLGNLLTNIFCNSNYTDTQSGFRLLNAKAINNINLLQDDFSYCSEMIIQAEDQGLKIVETPIDVRYTDYSIRKGQDFQVGLTTAFHLLWKLFFK